MAPAVLTLVGYGSWAVYANRDHGWQAASRAGVAQGAMSFAATFGLTVIATWLFRWGATPEVGAVLAILLTPVAVVGPMAIGHWLAGTPHVVKTITPSAIIGTSYVVAYVAGLLVVARRGARAEAAPPPEAGGRQSFGDGS